MTSHVTSNFSAFEVNYILIKLAYNRLKFVLNRTGNQLCQIGGIDIIVT